MDAIDVIQMRTDALVQAFIDKARPIHCPLNFGAPPQTKTPEREAIIEDIKAIAAELVSRNALEQARALMDHEDRNVRAWAAARMTAIDREWSDAAHRGLVANISTHEVVELCALAKQPPLARSAMQAMTTEQLIARIEAIGISHHAVQSMRGNFEAFEAELSDRVELETGDLFSELTERNAQGQIVPLMEHENASVQILAATMLLSLAPELAVPALERIAAGPSFEKISASMRLWRHQKAAEVPDLAYARMSPDDLIEEFIRMTNLLRSVVDPSWRWPEWRELRDDLFALGIAMRARVSIPRLYRLLGHGSPYVRGWAFELFLPPVGA